MQFSEIIFLGLQIFTYLTYAVSCAIILVDIVEGYAFLPNVP